MNCSAHRRIEARLLPVGFQETCRREDFDWSAFITMDPRLLDAAFSQEFLGKHEHVMLAGTAGVGKSFHGKYSSQSVTTFRASGES